MAGIFDNAGNPYLTNYAPSLAESKTDAMAAKVDYKLARLDPAAADRQREAELQRLISKYSQAGGLAGRSRFDDLVDFGQASIYREGQNSANFVTGQSNPNLGADADLFAGVRPEVRQRVTTATDDSVGSLADARINFREGNYLQSLGDIGSAVNKVLPVLPELAVDSLAGSLVSGAVGTAATAGVGAIPIALKKLTRAGIAIDGIGDAVQAAVAAKDAKKKLNTVQRALAYTAKSASQTSFMTASILQQNEEDYIRENGEPSSAVHKIVNAPVAIALNILEKGIFMSFLPSKSGAKAAARASKDYVKEVTAVLSDVPKKYSKQVAMRILGASGKAAKVGGAEAVQEYLQTWHSILQSKMDDASIRSALDQLRDEGNIDEANFSALVGAMVGGGIKVATQAPTVAAGSALDVMLGTASTATRVGAKVANKAKEVVTDSTTKASLALYTPEERAAVAEQNKAAQKAGDEDVAVKQTEIDVIENAKTAAAMHHNTNVSSRLAKLQESEQITTEQMADPEILKAVKDKLISELKGQQSLIKAGVYGSSKARVLKKVGENVIDKSIVKAQSLLSVVNADELVATATKVAGELSDASVTAIKGIKSSTARGVLNMALTQGGEKINTAVKAASALELSDLSKVIDVLEEKSPDIVPKFKKAYEKKLKAAKNLGTRNDNLTTLQKISNGFLKLATGTAISKAEAPHAFVGLSELIGGKIADLEALEVIEAVMRRYKQTDEATAGTNKASIGALEARLADQGNRIRQPMRTKAKAKVAEAAADIKSKGLAGLAKDTALVKALSEALNSETAQDLKKKAKSLATKLPDMPDLSTPEGTDKFNKMVDDTFAAASVKVKKAATSVKETVVGPEKVSEEVQKKRDALDSQLSGFEAMVADGADISVVLPVMPALIPKLKAAEYSSLDQALTALDKFPALRKSDAILAALKEAYQGDVKKENTVNAEPADSIDSSPPSTYEEGKKLYNENNPLECQLP